MDPTQKPERRPCGKAWNWPGVIEELGYWTHSRPLLEVARANPNVLNDPPPKVWFRSFGDSSLDFELLAWNTNLVHSKGQFISDLNFAIYEKFKEHGIEIPFPQRDLHIRSVNGGEFEIKRPASKE